MQAASRQSYAAALDQLDRYASGATPEQLRAVADELLAVAGLLAGQPRLRRALSDPARAGASRAELLRDLVGDQLGEPTRELLDTLVAGRWSAPSELLDGIEQLGVQALLASAAQAGQLAEVEDELFRFGQVMAGNPALAAALGDRSVPVPHRATITDELLAGRPVPGGAGAPGAAGERSPQEGRATEVTFQLVRVALGGGSRGGGPGQGFGGRSVAGALTRLVELAAERRDRSVAYVTVATPLTEAEEQRLGAALSARYGRDVSVRTTVDARVLGGARVQIGADLYDGTIAHRLTQARTAMATG
jgi:F-type H+-transporting ATPase subunit delta